jgi:FMN phosphatase YigB (HAD superfamily)
MSKLSLFIFDMDNTLYDWYAAFLPAFYEMVEVASKSLDCDREELLNQLQEVHVRHHDVEHPFSLAETRMVQTRITTHGHEDTWRLIDPAFHAFNRLRKQNLRLFPDTLETLEELRSHNVELVAYTDSTYFAALGRIQRLGLSDLFARVYCRERGQSHLPNSSTGSPENHDSKKVVEIPSHQSKPNPRVLGDIVFAQNQNIENVAYVGDSLSRDVLMAKRAHCYAIWARYGAHTDAQMYERLIRISHWTAKDILNEKNYAREAKNYSPDFTCERSIAEMLVLLRSD